MYLNGCILAVALVFGSSNLKISFAGPFHAQCKVEWYITVPCEQVFEGLVTQIKKWGAMSSCVMGGQKCLYKLQAASTHFIAAKHSTPFKTSVDDITFRLASSQLSSHCHVSAMSVSEKWYAIKDHGTNYCNLYNLMEGSGLTDAPGYKEITSDFLCTQRSTANCTVY